MDYFIYTSFNIIIDMRLALFNMKSLDKRYDQQYSIFLSWK